MPRWVRLSGRAQIPRVRRRLSPPTDDRPPIRYNDSREAAFTLAGSCVLALVVIGLVTCAIAFPALVWLWVLVPFAVVAAALLIVVVTDSVTKAVVVFVVLGFASAILLGTAIDGSLLFVRGVTVHASITGMSHYAYRADVTYQYSLVTSGGTRVPGGTYDVSADASDKPPYRVGDKITVVYDPKGVVSPASPDTAQPQTSQFVLAAIAMAAMIGCFVRWGVRAERRRAGATRSGHGQGAHGRQRSGR